jgi:hypothetical protein
MKPGGVIATPARHAERFPRASAFGEWQPGLRSVDGLSAMLDAYHVSPALADAVFAADELIGGFRGNRGIDLLAPWAGCFPGSTRRTWKHGTLPPHWYTDAWYIGQVDTDKWPEPHWLDERGSVWAHWEYIPVEDGEIHKVGTSVEGWFTRQLYLRDHGFDWPATCTTEETLPSGLQLRDDLSDEVAKVYDDGDAVWLVDDRGIQRMSRHVSTVAEVLAAAARVWEPK